MHEYTQMHAHTDACTHTCMHARTHAHTHAHTHTHTHRSTEKECNREGLGDPKKEEDRIELTVVVLFVKMGF